MLILNKAHPKHLEEKPRMKNENDCTQIKIKVSVIFINKTVFIFIFI